VWLFTVVFFWLQCLTMQWILQKQGCRVHVNTLFGVSSITALYSLVLPGILSTGVKWYILKRLTGRGSNVLSSMLYNQVTLSVVMAAIGLAALVVTNPAQAVFPGVRHTWIVPVVSGLCLVALIAATVLLLNRWTGAPVTRRLQVLLAWLPRGVRDKGCAMLDQIAVFQTAGFRFHAVIAFVNLLNSLIVGVLIYLCAARAAGIGISVSVLLWLCALVFLLSKVPITVANLGVREVTLVSLLAGYGVEQSNALLMSVILFSSLVFMAGLGAVYQVIWRAGKGEKDRADGAAVESVPSSETKGVGDPR
jgi:uncharacterized membrane protein YbhN (UPF0104 family)